VTGATGFVGSNLVERLVHEGSEVFVYARPGAWLKPAGLTTAVHTVRGDVEDEAATRRAIHESAPEVIFHLASTSFNPPTADGSKHLRVIAVGTRNVLAAVPSGANVRIVATGSGAEYGSGSDLTEASPIRPATELGVAKAVATLLMQTFARMHHHQTVTLRLFTPYGPWEAPGRLIPHTVLSALRHEDVQMSSGRQQRDFVFVDDVVDALLLAASEPVAPGSVYNISSGQGTSILEVVRTILSLMGNPVQAVLDALPTRADEIWACSGNNTAARHGLGWAPSVALRDGLERSIAWQRQYGLAAACR
jgi:nucleoside-diphosphate-sugar epimerase